MKPYNRRKPLKYNYTDCHPQKGYENWWEDMNSLTKSSVRKEAKREINKELEDGQDKQD